MRLLESKGRGVTLRELEQVEQTVSAKGQIGNVLGTLETCMVSVATAQVCHCSTQAGRQSKAGESSCATVECVYQNMAVICQTLNPSDSVWNTD